MHTLKVAAMLSVLLLWALHAQAEPITTVEWETKPGAPWSYAGGVSGSGAAIDCTVPPSPSGGCALRFYYPAGTYPLSFGGGRAEYALPVGQMDLYIGAWMRYSNPFQFHTNGQKVNFFILAGSNTGCRNVSFGYIFSKWSATPQICWGPGTQNNYENLLRSWDEQAHLNEWFWVEQRMKLNTPGGFNGAADLWINDVPYLHYTNLPIRAPGDNALWGSMQHTAEYGGGGSTVSQNQYWWVDHTVISTTRIGRPGGPPPSTDTTPPLTPAGLNVQ